MAAVARRTRWHGLTEDAAKFERRGSAVRVLDDGRWTVAEEATETMQQVRSALRERVALVRRHGALSADPAALEAARAEWERRRAAHRAELARLSHALLVTFPLTCPRAAVLLDVGEHAISTFVDDALGELRARLSTYDVIGAVQVRAQLRALAFDSGQRRLAELEPPQKTKQLNRSGRTLKITTALLVQGSCGISKPFGEDGKLTEYLATGATAKLLRRLEVDAKSLHALYEYARLHGAMRLRWGFVDERIPAPWVARDEPTLRDVGSVRARSQGQRPRDRPPRPPRGEAVGTIGRRPVGLRRSPSIWSMTRQTWARSWPCHCWSFGEMRTRSTGASTSSPSGSNARWTCAARDPVGALVAGGDSRPADTRSVDVPRWTQMSPPGQSIHRDGHRGTRDRHHG